MKTEKYYQLRSILDSSLMSEKDEPTCIRHIHTFVDEDWMYFEPKILTDDSLRDILKLSSEIFYSSGAFIIKLLK